MIFGRSEILKNKVKYKINAYKELKCKNGKCHFKEAFCCGSPCKIRNFGMGNTEYAFTGTSIAAHSTLANTGEKITRRIGTHGRRRWKT